MHQTPAATDTSTAAVPSPRVPGDAPLAAAEPVSPLASSRSTVHREAVVTLDGRVVGYAVAVTVDSANAVSADLLHAQYMALDLPNLVADRYVFLPATPEMLDGFLPVPAVPGRLVLDLPPGFEHRPDATARAAALRALGAHLALVGYVGDPAQEALLPHVTFVVVDLDRLGSPLPPVVHHLHGAGVRVLAAGVADEAGADACRAAGVDALRGGEALRHASPPPIAESSSPRVLRAGQMQCLALMHLLNQPEIDFAAVSQVMDTDPVLTLRVLHLVNSGAFSLVHEVDTVHQAVVLLGAREVTTLVTALLVDARPDAMDSLWFILARALACEELADDQAGYTVGMLSALAEQLGVPADVIVEKVGVSPAVADAIRAEEGDLGAVLFAVKSHERSDSAGLLTAGLDPAHVSSTYVACLADALATARTVTRSESF